MGCAGQLFPEPNYGIQMIFTLAGTGLSWAVDSYGVETTLALPKETCPNL